MNKASATLQFVAAEAARSGRTVNQLILPDSSIKAACIGYKDGTAALGISVTEAEMHAIGELSDANGVEFLTEHDSVSSGRWFLIHALEAEDLPLFGPIADDLAEALLSGSRPDALIALGDAMRRWLNFLRIARKGLSPEAQLGLWGELETLRRAARSCGWSDAISAWVGPSHAAQDFIFGSWAVEVKTTVHPRQGVKIASLEQLDNEPWDALYLLHRTVKMAPPAEAPTLKQLVQSIREDLPAGERNLIDFETRLHAAGYHMAHENRYGKHGIIHESATLYLIRDGFPRILREGLHSGIIEAKYRIALNTAADFTCEISAASTVAQPLLTEMLK